MKRRAGSRTGGLKGCQIDLLIQTPETFCLVEIKRQNRIGHGIIAEMKEKCRLLPRPRSISLRTALVHTGELAPSVEASGYFDAIIPFSALLGL